MLNVWDVASQEPPGDDASDEVKAKYQQDVELLSWYVETWLPKVVDFASYPDNVRPHYRLSSLTNVAGEQKVRVTITREAYGLLQFENSRERWLACYKFEQTAPKVKGKKQQAPQYNSQKPETNRFKSKWSDYKAGQCSAWDPVAYQTFEQRKQHIKNHRAADEANGFKAEKFAMKLSKIAQGIKDEEAPPARSAGGKRSRASDDDDERSWHLSDENSEEEMMTYEDE